jgi:hypothetical protein
VEIRPRCEQRGHELSFINRESQVPLQQHFSQRHVKHICVSAFVSLKQPSSMLQRCIELQQQELRRRDVWILFEDMRRKWRTGAHIRED